MQGKGMIALAEYIEKKNCCITKFNLIDHGGGGVQQVGSKGTRFTKAHAKVLCDSICKNQKAVITFYGCFVGMPNKHPAIDNLLEICPEKIKGITACTTTVNHPGPDSGCCDDPASANPDWAIRCSDEDGNGRWITYLPPFNTPE